MSIELVFTLTPCVMVGTVMMCILTERAGKEDLMGVRLGQNPGQNLLPALCSSGTLYLSLLLFHQRAADLDLIISQALESTPHRAVIS